MRGRYIDDLRVVVVVDDVVVAVVVVVGGGGVRTKVSVAFRQLSLRGIRL